MKQDVEKERNNRDAGATGERLETAPFHSTARTMHFVWANIAAHPLTTELF